MLNFIRGKMAESGYSSLNEWINKWKSKDGNDNALHLLTDEFDYVSKNGNTRHVTDYYEGVVNNLERRYLETSSGWIREWLENFMVENECRNNIRKGNVN